MTRARLVALAAVVLLAFAGCARRVVIPPSKVPARNSPDWVIEHLPSPSDAGTDH